MREVISNIRLQLVIKILALLWSGIGWSLTAMAASNLTKVEQVPGEFIVKLKDDVSVKNFKNKNKNINKNILQNFASIKKDFEISQHHYLLLKSNSSQKILTMEQLQNIADFAWVEPNYIYHIEGFEDHLKTNIIQKQIQTTPQDALYSKLWGLSNVNQTDISAEKAWDLEQGSKDIKIAIIDTGIDYNHEDLKNQIWTNDAELNGKEGVDDDQNGVIDDIHGAGFIDGQSFGNPIDDHSHGTHCAGTIAGEHNDIGVAGVMHQVTLVPVKFLSATGSGSTADAISAIQYATKIGVDIMSNSWGGGGYSKALEDAIKEAQKKGIIFVVAAGNNGSNNDEAPSYPSSYNLDNVISVGAYGVDDKIAYFSNYGKKSVHVFAPGVGIVSSVLNNSYKSYSGTSMATPHVAGVIGLYLSKFGHQDPKLMRELLMRSTVKSAVFDGMAQSSGRVNAYNLLAQVYPRIVRPNEKTWKVKSLSGFFRSNNFEINSSYAPNTEIKFQYKVAGAKFIRIVFDQFNIESNNSKLSIYDNTGKLVEIISGVHDEKFKSRYFRGDALTLVFTGDGVPDGQKILVNKIEFNTNSTESDY